MRLPGLSRFTAKNKKKEPPREYIALQIGQSQCKAALWSHTSEITIKELVKGTTPQEVLSQVIHDSHATEVVFGLPDEYLEGNSIKQSYLPKLKSITEEAQITPIGFVVTHEAIANLMSKEHEAPQTGLLVGMEPTKLVFSLYRGGVCKSTTTVVRSANLFEDFEKALEAFANEEILPSKIVLYNDGDPLDDIKEQLLSYPWQGNDKFLHVPKIETLPWEYSIKAIVYAGVNEMSTEHAPATAQTPPATAMPVVAKQAPTTPSDPIAQEEEIAEPSTAPANPIPPSEPTQQDTPEQSDSPSERYDTPDEEHDYVSSHADDSDPEPPPLHINEPATSTDPLTEPTTAVDRPNETTVAPDPIIPEHSAESMGFMQNTDILETPQQTSPFTEQPRETTPPLPEVPKPEHIPHETPVDTAHIPQQEPIHADSHQTEQTASIQKKRISLPSLPSPHALAIRGPKALVPLAVLVLVALGALGTMVYSYPKLSVSLLAEPKIIENEVEVTLNTSIDNANPDSKEIPGRIHSVSVLGSRSKSTTGTKTIGEKATGTVTLLNKTTKKQSIGAGSVLSAGSISFTLDDTVAIASASDTGESLTYGKTTASVTASKIGPDGNISKDTTFSIEGYNTDTVSAKSADDFSGGTEREVTVVSQEDLQSLEDDLVTELKMQASDKLKGQVLGSETFLDDSLQENVVEKTFDKDSGDESDLVSLELDLEISQTSYREDDIKELMNTLMKDQISDGFMLDDKKSYVTVLSSSQSEEDSNEVTFTASYTAFLLPDLETNGFNQDLAGKSIDQLTSYVSDLTDQNIVGYEIQHERKLPFYPNLPLRPENITVTVVPY